MNLGQISVITAGLFWLAAAGVLLEVSRVLGPAFDTKATVHPFWRAVAWCGALIMCARGVTLLFPGKLIEVSRISVMAPLGALAVLGVTLALLDWIMRDRAPPPWSVQVLRLSALLGRDGPVRFAAMNVPPAAVGDLAPVEERPGQRRSRLPILIGAILLLAAIAAFLALNSPAAALAK